MDLSVMHIVGNRPQFIKLAPISREIRKRGYREFILHSGQHYDKNMSEIFFRELEIPHPDINLKVGSGTHAEITARALIGIEKQLQKEKPDIVILYGDTDTTLAGALAANKLKIKTIHIEAGPRSFHKENPEECNRIVADHISDILCCPDQTSMVNLWKEGLGKKAYFTGDVMYDEFLYCSRKGAGQDILLQNGLDKEEFILLTWHRQENTESKRRMLQILDFIGSLKQKILFPIHPRTKKMLKEYDLFQRMKALENVTIIEPVGYLEMLSLVNSCGLVLTDSGGLSKEAYFAGKQCLFMLDLDIWPELLKDGSLVKVNFNQPDKYIKYIEDAANKKIMNDGQHVLYYGDGNASSKVIDLIEASYTTV